MKDLTAAIKRIETSRQTHVDWRDYWLSTPGHEDCDPCKATAAIAGDLDRQVRVIAEYDNVLACLREAESAEAAHEAEKAAHERLRAGIWALGESIHGDEGVEHVEGCEGEPTCFACILDTLRALLGGGGAR